jgi:2-C-methyl-D-erythritol 2,4-cyclodiphosphate synthase
LSVKAAGARIGIGYDLHRLVPGRPLFLGTVNIPYPSGLFGHSDGDVLCHAIADAILGAAGLGEIGIHYPDNDHQCKGIAGRTILALGDLIAGEDLRSNADAVVIAERPRSTPPEMIAGSPTRFGSTPADLGEDSRTRNATPPGKARRSRRRPALLGGRVTVHSPLGASFCGLSDGRSTLPSRP